MKQSEVVTFKPDWKDAPDWANYLAMDSDGSWHWYASKPKLDFYDNTWEVDPDSDDLSTEEAFDPRDRWLDALEERP